MESLIEARGSISAVDIRFLNKENCDSWIDSAMRDFVYDSEIFNFTKLNGSLRSTVLDLIMTNEALKKELNKPWNANLPGHDNVKGQLQIHHEDIYIDTKIGTPNPKKAKVERDGKDSKEKFVKITPKQENVELKQCEFCDKSYQSLKALEQHRNKKHPNQQFKKTVKEEKDQITCRICEPHKKIKRDQMITHLKRVHKIVKPEGTELRGWERMNVGHSYKPAFRHPHDPDLIEVAGYISKESDSEEGKSDLDDDQESKNTDEEEVRDTEKMKRKHISKVLFTSSLEANEDKSNPGKVSTEMKNPLLGKDLRPMSEDDDVQESIETDGEEARDTAKMKRKDKKKVLFASSLEAIEDKGTPEKASTEMKNPQLAKDEDCNKRVTRSLSKSTR